MKKNTAFDNVPDWLQWAVLFLVALAILKKVAPSLLKFTGTADVFADIKENANEKAVEEVLKKKPENHQRPTGGVYTVEEGTIQATSIRNWLGLDFPVYDPRRWYEEDGKIFDLLSKYHNSGTFTILRSRYNAMYSGSELVADLEKYLDSSYLSKVKHLWA